MSHSTPEGYVWLTGPEFKDHPLATRNGVARHRHVLFMEISGYADEHIPCHWCKFPLPWRAPEGAHPAARHCINVDHLNGTPGDDRVENLVPACAWCNSNRQWAMALAPVWFERFCRWFGQIHPAQRPNLPAIVGEILGISPYLLTGSLPKAMASTNQENQ